MGDDDTDDLHAGLHSDPRILMATTLATLVIAGSAFMWRSLPSVVGGSPRHACTDPDSMLAVDNEFAGTELKFQSKCAAQSTSGSASDDCHGSPDPEESKEMKTSRSKERRRRGKDPLKEILKGAKKNKGFVKLSRAPGPDDAETGSSTSSPKISGSSHEHPLPTSSRSSSVSTSNKRSPLPDWPGPDYEFNKSNHAEDNNDHAAAFLSTPAVSESFADPLATTVIGSGHSESSASSQTSELAGTPDFPDISLPSSSTSQYSAAPSFESVSTPNTSPISSPSGKTPTLSQTGSSLPKQEDIPIKLTSSPTSSPPPKKTQKPAPGPWDWDGASTSLNSEFVSRKPPRFRSTSRNSGTTPSIPELTTISDASTASSIDPFSMDFGRGSMGSLDEAATPFAFPTLNATSSSAAPPGSPVPSKVGTHMSNSTNATGNTPRRAPTPRRPPTPHSGTGTPPPSLSVQTQLASLRGALEAARMREEKSKIDLDRYSKDLELLRYELVASRQREVELQTQMRHLLHQQSYAALYSPSLTSTHTAPSSNPNGLGSSNGPSTSNGYTSASNHPSSPIHVPIPSPAQMMLANGILSSPPILSPLAMGSPHLPFYPYSPQSTHPHPHLHQTPVAPSPHTLYSMLYPQPSSMGSGPSSTAGSSSTGSQSPDLAGSSSTPPLASVSRGRRGTHRRNGEGEDGDGWIVNDDEFDGDCKAKNPYSDEDDLSEVLADAILKRPGSIRALSRRKKELESVQHVEFTFPSISDYGNVTRGYSAPVVEEADPVQKDIEVGALESCEETPKGEEPEKAREALYPADVHGPDSMAPQDVPL